MQPAERSSRSYSIVVDCQPPNARTTPLGYKVRRSPLLYISSDPIFNF
jgi:hypothetical protein